MKTAVHDLTANGWTAGGVYSSILFRALREAGSDTYYLSDSHSGIVEGRFSSLGENYLPGEWTLRRLFGIGRKNKWAATVKKHEIGAIGPILHPAQLVSRVKNLAWIPDFQPFLLSDLYDEAELSRIFQRTKTLVTKADRIILSSLDSHAVFQELFPEMAHKARVLSFPSALSFDQGMPDPGDVLKKYSLPEKFILLANQFWKHKNHKTVIQAMRLLRERSNEIPFLVLTGLPADFRDRNNTMFSELLQEISSSAIRDQVCMLGLVPREDLLGLLRRASAIVQPSLFEGWNTTVEDAKALRCPLLVSEIAVHREQAPHAMFFDPRDPASCAFSLSKTWMENEPPSTLRDVDPEYRGQRIRFGQLAREIFENWDAE